MARGSSPHLPRSYGVGVISEAEIANPTITRTIAMIRRDLTVPVRRMGVTSVR
jgi:hypothetical protein